MLGMILPSGQHSTGCVKSGVEVGFVVSDTVVCWMSDVTLPSERHCVKDMMCETVEICVTVVDLQVGKPLAGIAHCMGWGALGYESGNMLVVVEMVDKYFLGRFGVTLSSTQKLQDVRLCMGVRNVDLWKDKGKIVVVANVGNFKSVLRMFGATLPSTQELQCVTVGMSGRGVGAVYFGWLVGVNNSVLGMYGVTLSSNQEQLCAGACVCVSVSVEGGILDYCLP